MMVRVRVEIDVSEPVAFAIAPRNPSPVPPPLAAGSMAMTWGVVASPFTNMVIWSAGEARDTRKPAALTLALNVKVTVTGAEVVAVIVSALPQR